ncbi:putative transporter [Trachipleistophora hominis]|uniref:Putative transporter n=1 Tax=Trachipleistophora hominis TaxID=72359 RepID=L7JZW3_TRAHO|nr:putative transporter [Trachipleistophora hominis]
MLTSLSIKDLWVTSNATFIALYSLYVSSWIIRLPFAVGVPRIMTNMSVATAYFLTLYPQKHNLDLILENTNTFCLLFFLTNPPLLYMLPFYISSIVNISSVVITHPKLKRYGFASYCHGINKNRESIIMISYIIELCMIPLVVLFSVLGYSSFFNMVSYGLLIRMSLKIDMMMRRALLIILQVIDSKIVNLPKDWQKLYMDLKDYMQVKHMVVSEEVKDK